MSTHTLVSTHWRVRIAANRGMRWLSGEGFVGGQWLSIMPDGTATDTDLKDCNFPLLPFSNRIRAGQFVFAGKSYQLNDAQRHAIHGFLRHQPWQVSEAADHRLETAFTSGDAHTADWPWPLAARCILSVNGPVLNCQLEVQNLGNTEMPIGGGWHPYFVRNLHTAHPHLTIPVKGVYPDTDGDCLPTGAAVPIPDQLSFANNKKLQPDQRIDHCFSGLSQPLQIHWPDVDVTVTMRGSANVTHAILFNPDKPYFALEPVTHANDGVNLAAQGIQSGIETLAPGDTWRANLDMVLS